MSKEVMRQALDALELNTTIEGGYCSCCGHQPCLKTCSVIQAIDALRAALDAPSIKRTLTAQEQSIELDAGMAAQNYCRKLWGAARGHSDWRKFHDAFVAGYIEASTTEPLTDARLDEIMKPLTQNVPYSWREFARAIEKEVRAK